MIRWRWAIRLGIAVAAVCAVAAPIHAQSTIESIALTDEEAAWVREHPVVRFSGTVDWLPFEYVEDGVYKGIAADYLNVIAERTGLTFELVPGISWTDALQSIQDGRLDILPCVGVTDDRKQFLSFTDPYISSPLVIVTRDDEPDIRTVDDLNGRIVAVPKDYYTHEVLQQDQPAVQFHLTSTEAEAVRAVAIGQADAYVGNLTIFSYFVNKLSLSNLTVAGPTPYDNADLSMAVRQDAPVLRAIIQKALDSMSTEEKQAIYDGWVTTRFEYGISPAEIAKYTILAVAIGVIVVVVIALWNASLQRQIRERKRAEALQQRYEFIANAVNDRMSLINRDLVYEAVNESWCRDLGIDRQEAIGKHVVDVWGEKVVAGVLRDPLSRVFNGENVTYQTWLRSRSGGRRYCDVGMFPFRDEQGGVSHAVVVTRDITKQHEAQLALQDSEQRLKLALAGARAGTFHWDVINQKLEWDARSMEIYGIRPEDFHGTYADWADRLHEDDRERAEASYQEALEQDATWDITYRLLRPDGEVRHAHVSGYFVRNASGAAQALAGLHFDITDQVQAQEELEENRQFLRGIIDNSTAFIYAKEIDGRYLLVNKQWEIIGVRDTEIAGKTDYDLFPAEVADEYRRNDHEVISRREPIEAEEIIPVNGENRSYISVKFPIFDAQGDVVATCGMSTDITDLKRIQAELADAKEAADAANKAKSDFLATMSHEIRTPMNAVIGLTHLALKTDLSPKQRDYLVKIHGASNQLLGIINDILDFSKIEAGKMDIEAVPFNLDSVLDNLANVTTARAQEREDLEVLFRVPSEVPRDLVGDPLRLGQVLINLCSNAVKFTERGQIIVECEILQQSAASCRLRFSIRDTGIGLTEVQRQRLFQPFQQADSSTTRRYGGTGLGLTISKRLVEMMKGEIGVDSMAGQGSNFWFTAQFAVAKEKTVPALFSAPDLRNLKVLVVDDNRDSLEILEEMLSSFGYEVVLASDAEEAFKCIEDARTSREFDLILMDWRMPGMNGVDAALRIKQDDRLYHVPCVILVTAYGRDGVIHQVEQAGLDAVLLKPMSQSTLFDTIMTVFGKRLSSAISRDAGAQGEQNVRKILGGARVLLVEDNEINQQVATELLAGAGLHVEVAHNGQEAIDAINRAPYDIVFMDCQMPVIDGFEATRRVRAQGKWSDLPIVAMTANAMAGDRQKCLEAGMNAHVAKPIDPALLYDTLLEWVRPREGLGIVDSADESADSPAQAIPAQIDGIDVEDGLRRVGGNAGLYLRLLRNFRRSYGDSATAISALVASGSQDDAARLAHTIKGVSGNIGATDVQTAAADLEAHLKRGGEATGEIMRPFASAVAAVIAALDAALPEEIGETIEAEAIADPRRVAAAALRLLAAIDTDLAEAQAEAVHLRAAVGQGEFAVKARQVEECLEAFDTDGARDAIHALAEAMGIVFEGTEA